jgi:hypothetical protein
VYRFSFYLSVIPISIGLYGLQRGIVSTPSSKFKVKLNSVLNHSGRYGSRVGNTLGVFAVLYSLYEGLGDTVSIQSICYIISIEYLFVIAKAKNTSLHRRLLLRPIK